MLKLIRKKFPQKTISLCRPLFLYLAHLLQLGIQDLEFDLGIRY